jgi:hypothetical protein
MSMIHITNGSYRGRDMAIGAMATGHARNENMLA